jgi:hypothetical protein
VSLHKSHPCTCACSQASDTSSASQEDRQRVLCLGSLLLMMSLHYRALYMSLSRLSLESISVQEDEILTRLVGMYGPRNWSVIASGIPGRTGKSCRLRCGACSRSRICCWERCNDLNIVRRHRAGGATSWILLLKRMHLMILRMLLSRRCELCATSFMSL